MSSMVAIVVFKHTVRRIYATIRFVILVNTVGDHFITLESFPFILWLVRLLGQQLLRGYLSRKASSTVGSNVV